MTTDGTGTMATRGLTCTAVLLALATAALTGCGTDDPAPATVPTVSAAGPAGPAGPSAGGPGAGESGTGGPGTAGPGTGGPGTGGPAGDGAGAAAFVTAVRAALPEVAADRRDEEISSIAEQACAALSRGSSADDVVAQTRSLGTVDAEATDHATARELIKLAIDTVCPGQAERVDEF